MIEVPRHEGEGWPAPGTWTRIVGGEVPGAMVRFVCPNGHSGSLEDHEVDPDGRVHPSVVCPEPTCGFHDYVRLLDYGPPS